MKLLIFEHPSDCYYRFYKKKNTLSCPLNVLENSFLVIVVPFWTFMDSNIDTKIKPARLILGDPWWKRVRLGLQEYFFFVKLQSKSSQTRSWLCFTPVTTRTRTTRRTPHQKYQLLLTGFWWYFKGSFLGTSRTDSDSHGDICPNNICPGDIWPYQEYLSCYWPNFDETLNILNRCQLPCWHLSRKFAS